MSTINDTDVFLINRGTASYKCQANQLLDKVIDTDFLLVNRGSTSYKVAFSNANDVILDTDWLLINRGSTSYKVSGADFKTLLGQVFGFETDINQTELSFLSSSAGFMFEFGTAVNDANETLQVGWGYQNVSGSARAIGLCLCHNPDGTLKWTRRFKGQTSTTDSTQAARFQIYCKPIAFANGDWAIGFGYDHKFISALDGGQGQNFERPPAFLEIARDGTVSSATRLISGREDVGYICDVYQIHRRSNGKFAVYFNESDYRACYAELQSDLSFTYSIGRSRRYTISTSQLNPTASTIDVANDKMYATGTRASNSYQTFIKHTIESTTASLAPDWAVQYQAKDGISNFGVEGAAISDGNPVFWVREGCTNSSGFTCDDITVFKLNSSNGSLVWGLRLGDSRTAGSNRRNFYGNYHNELACDDDGNIYLSVRSNEPATANTYRGYVVKINSSGTLQWAREFRYTDGNDVQTNPSCTAISVDKTGNVVFVFGDSLLKLKPDGAWAGSYSTSGYQPITISNYTFGFSTSATTGSFSLGTFSSVTSIVAITTADMTGFSSGSISGWTQDNSNYVGQTFTVPG